MNNKPIRLIVLAVVIIVCVVSIGIGLLRVSGTATSPHDAASEYMRRNPLELSRLYHDRSQRLWRIWNSLGRYRMSHNRWPSTMDEWLISEPNAAALLTAPQYAPAGYIVNWDALNGPLGSIVVRDPGAHWPPITGLSESYYERAAARGRIDLLNDGTFRYYNWEKDGKP